MTDATITAPSYALLQSSIACWKCGVATPVTAIWVPCFAEVDEDGSLEESDPAVLQYIESMDASVQASLAESSPYLRPGESRTAGITYWANQCSHCGTIQGDHHVMGVDGPFFPQSQGDLDSVLISPAVGSLTACAGYSLGGWMNWVTDRLGNR